MRDVPADPDVAACLRSIRELSERLAQDIAELSPATWEGPTNCPPWRVRDLAVHLVTSGEGFVASIRNGLAGSTAPPAAEGRERRHAELNAAGPHAVAAALRAVTETFERLYAGLPEQQLASICFHRRGNRSVRWYAAHRLAEVAFHGWDLWTSCGRAPRLDDEVAMLLLPTLLESNVPRTYAAGQSAERGRGERFQLTVRDDPSAAWQVTIEPDQLTSRRGSGQADLTIVAPPAALALLVYGRADLHGLVNAGVARLEGEAALVDRFALIFPRP